MERLDSLLLNANLASPVTKYISKNQNSQKSAVQIATNNPAINSALKENHLQENWSKALDIIKSEVNSKLYSAWFSSLKFLDANLSTDILDLKLLAPNNFTKDHIFREHKSLLVSAVKKAYSSKRVKIAFKVLTNSPTKKNKISSKDLAKDYNKSRPNNSSLNPNYSFSNFIVGQCNKIAHDSCLNASKNLGKVYNPLFIYGDSGLGKTHLANAIGNKCIKENKKVLFVSSERFVSELVASIRNKKMDTFKLRFRNSDLLIIDDIQFIIGKQRTQEEFFHTFNELFEKQKQIIITSDKAPQHFENLEPRLRSRFSSGLSIDLKSPDIDTIKKVILNNSAKLALNLSEESISLISSRVNSNFRELEGAINRISAISKNPSPEQILEVLNNLYPRKHKKVSAPLIMELVSDKFNLEVKDLTGKRRTKNIAAARHIAMYLCRDITALSYPEIGRLFGGRDHSTAIHAFKTVEKKMLGSQEYKQELESIRNSIRN